MAKHTCKLLRTGLPPLWVDEARFWDLVDNGWAGLLSRDPLVAQLLARQEKLVGSRGRTLPTPYRPFTGTARPAAITEGEMQANVSITGRHEEPGTPANQNQVSAAQDKIAAWPFEGARLHRANASPETADAGWLRLSSMIEQKMRAIFAREGRDRGGPR